MLLGVNVVLGVQSALSETVPGASDNASGVAAVLELARRYVEQPLEDTEVIVLCPSGEEVGLAGMYQWLHISKEGLTPFRNALVVSLDTLGAGEPAVARGESFTGRYREDDLALVDEDVPRIVLGAGTDAMAARYAALPAVSILSWTDGGFTNYHLPTDTADRLSWESVELCLGVADRTIRRWHAAR
jgi:Zn-dependent M28 family amino/carboxypeptidase